MFGYNYGIKTNDKNTKTLDISVNLDYLKSFNVYKDEITTDIIENILDNTNPIGIIQEYIAKEYEKNWK